MSKITLYKKEKCYHFKNKPCKSGSDSICLPYDNNCEIYTEATKSEILSWVRENIEDIDIVRSFLTKVIGGEG